MWAHYSSAEQKKPFMQGMKVGAHIIKLPIKTFILFFFFFMATLGNKSFPDFCLYPFSKTNLTVQGPENGSGAGLSRLLCKAAGTVWEFLFSN